MVYYKPPNHRELPSGQHFTNAYNIYNIIMICVYHICDIMDMYGIVYMYDTMYTLSCTNVGNISNTQEPRKQGS